MEILKGLLDVILYGLGAYLLGAICLVPGMVLGRHLEMTGPKWPVHLAVLVLGVVVSALVFGR